MVHSNSLTGRKVHKRKLFFKNRTPREIKRILPPLSKFPTIQGKWQRLASGQIRAWYTPDEYAQCKKMFEDLKGVRPIGE